MTGNDLKNAGDNGEVTVFRMRTVGAITAAMTIALRTSEKGGCIIGKVRGPHRHHYFCCPIIITIIDTLGILIS